MNVYSFNATCTYYLQRVRFFPPIDGRRSLQWPRVLNVESCSLGGGCLETLSTPLIYKYLSVQRTGLLSYFRLQYLFHGHWQVQAGRKQVVHLNRWNRNSILTACLTQNSVPVSLSQSVPFGRLPPFVVKSCIMDAVIEVSSSPEPFPEPWAGGSRKRATKKPITRGRKRSTLNNFQADSDIIELTDSDDDTGDTVWRELAGAGKGKGKAVVSNHRNEAGPSRLGGGRMASGQPKPLAGSSSGSLENIPGGSRRPGGKSRAPPVRGVLPLFLPSDEENEPPRRDVDDALDDPFLDFGALENHQALRMPSRAPASPPPSSSSSSAIQRNQTPNPEPERERDPLSQYLAQVLEIVPDVQPEFALSLLSKHLPDYQDKVLEPVLHSLFEDPSYPKIDRKGKRKRASEDEGDAQRAKVRLLETDYGNATREYKGGVHYPDLAIVSPRDVFHCC